MRLRTVTAIPKKNATVLSTILSTSFWNMVLKGIIYDTTGRNLTG